MTVCITPWLVFKVRDYAAARLTSHSAASTNANNASSQHSISRPLIYVYDMDPMFTQRMVQYRTMPDHCMHRCDPGCPCALLLCACVKHMQWGQPMPARFCVLVCK